MIGFDEKKKYHLIFIREGHQLVFTATSVQLIGSLISFTDKYNKQMIFPVDSLSQAKEVG